LLNHLGWALADLAVDRVADSALQEADSVDLVAHPVECLLGVAAVIAVAGTEAAVETEVGLAVGVTAGALAALIHRPS
jgi:hypothetical protein